MKINGFGFENINPTVLDKVFLHNIAFFAIIDFFVVFFTSIANVKPIENKNLMDNPIFCKI